MTPVSTWTVDDLDDAVTREFDGLADDLKDRLLVRLDYAVQAGFNNLRPPVSEVIDCGGEKVLEIRESGKSGEVRAYYVMRAGRRATMLGYLHKKTQKIPKRMVDLLAERAKRVK